MNHSNQSGKGFTSSGSVVHRKRLLAKNIVMKKKSEITAKCGVYFIASKVYGMVTAIGLLAVEHTGVSVQ